MPPACAIVIAIRLSVTVSIAELKSGMLRAIDWVTKVRVSTVLGSTLEAAGTSSTSSKVRASRISMRVLLGRVRLAVSYFTALRE